MTVRVAVVGAGRMGKLHARVLSEMDRAELACVVDSASPRAETVARQRGCPALNDVARAVELADAAVIAVPTSAHLEAARPFLQAGKSVLIEKPLVSRPEDGERLLELSGKTGAVVQVGHTERYNPTVLAMKRYEVQPKFIEAHRISPFTFRSADVGVVLDMMIHDIDLVLMLAGSEVTDLHAVGVNVIGEHEDICNARLAFANGCVANITASRLAIKTERKMRIFSEQAYLSMDYGRKAGIVIRKDENLDLIQMARQQGAENLADLAGKVDYAELLKVEELSVDESNEPLRLQAEAFCDAVTGQAPPPISGADGLAAVKCAHEIVRTIRAHRWDGAASDRQGLDILSRE